MAVVSETLRPAPRRVSGRCACAAAASAAVTPGTTVQAMPCAARACSSSSRRPNTEASPPLRRTTKPAADCACLTSSALISVCFTACAKPRLPTSIHRACGARSRSAGSVKASKSTTSASASKRAPRRVMRSALPGPALTKATLAITNPPRQAQRPVRRQAKRHWCGGWSGQRR